MSDPELSVEFFRENRERFDRQMEEGSLAVFHAATPVIKSLDQFHRYHQTSNFYYLTGIDFPGCILLVHPPDREDRLATLYIPKPDSAREVWEGEMADKDEVRDISGIRDVRYAREFDSDFVKFQSSREIVYLDYDDSGFRFPTSHESRLFERIRETLPGLQLRKAGLILAELRRRKSEEELGLIRKAIEITHEGLQELWAAMNSGVMEYELEATLACHFIKNRARVFAYEPIIASGPNATVLHYVDNERRMEDGDLLLTDVGAQYGHYCADITRTVPVNGSFSPRQREIYEAVLGVQEEMIDSVRTGTSLEDLKALARDKMGETLKSLELIGDDGEISNYYMHSIGHYLGLDTHDVGDLNAPLEPGNVLTIEPGIYIREEGIGIRIEDDVLVTEGEPEILSGAIPKTVDDLEEMLLKLSGKDRG